MHAFLVAVKSYSEARRDIGSHRMPNRPEPETRPWTTALQGLPDVKARTSTCSTERSITTSADARGTLAGHVMTQAPATAAASKVVHNGRGLSAITVV